MLPACDWFKRTSSQESGVETTSFYLLDANDADIYKAAHIPGATQVTLASVDDLTKSWNKSATIVVYCSPACGTKDLIAKKLRDAGFTNVKVYVGGITEWNKLSKENKEAYPIEGDAKHAIFEKESVPSVKKEASDTEITAEELKKHLSSANK